MGTPLAAAPENSAATIDEDLRTTLTRLERRDWRLWAVAVITLMLLFSAVAVLAAEIELRLDLTAQQQLEVAVRSLFALVLLFSAFVVYQQILIKRLRRHVAVQVAGTAVGTGEAETNSCQG